MEYKKKGYPLHVLLNNAAIQSPKGKRGAKTEEGFEVLLVVQSAQSLAESLLSMSINKSSMKPPAFLVLQSEHVRRNGCN